MKIALKPVLKSDAQLIFESWGNNHSNFRYLSVKPQNSVADAEEYLAAMLSNPDSLCFHILTSESGQVIGIIKAKREGHKALVGYVVDQAYSGRGIATQALNEMVKKLTTTPEIKRIWATCAIDNPGSYRVLEKCDFVREGRLKNWIVYPAQGNQPHDNYSYCWNSGG